MDWEGWKEREGVGVSDPTHLYGFFWPWDGSCDHWELKWVWSQHSEMFSVVMVVDLLP